MTPRLATPTILCCLTWHSRCRANQPRRFSRPLPRCFLPLYSCIYGKQPLLRAPHLPIFWHRFRFAGLDAALIHSTIDTIPSPNSLLARMGGARGVVRENGGLVVVVSAYDWNEEVTPVGAWLGGYLDETGNKVKSKERCSTLPSLVFVDISCQEH